MTRTRRGGHRRTSAGTASDGAGVPPCRGRICEKTSMLCPDCVASCPPPFSDMKGDAVGLVDPQTAGSGNARVVWFVGQIWPLPARVFTRTFVLQCNELWAHIASM